MASLASDDPARVRERDTADAVAALAARLGAFAPRVAIILGSGLSDLTGQLVGEGGAPTRVAYDDLSGFPHSGVSGHAGALFAGTLGETPVIMLAGREHYYENGRADAMRGAIETLKALGVTTLVATNAAGSLREDFAPGSVMLIEDHINWSGLNPLIGERSDTRFLNMVGAYDPALLGAMREAARAEAIEAPSGVYMWFSGPSFETPAEIRMARTLGADAVGMSTVPEVILARHAGLRVAAASVVTNLGAGMTGEALSHDETRDVAPRGGAKLARILARALPAMG